MADVDKFRYFAGFVYLKDRDGNQQITYEELVSRLRKSFGDFAISPIHDPDEDYDEKDDETHDCEHVHVIYRHDNTVQLKTARKWLLSINVPWHNDYIVPVFKPRNYQRYLAHLDHPDKQQFLDGGNSIVTVNNFQLNLKKELSELDKIEIQKQIESFAYEFNIFEYASMTKYLSDDENLIDHYVYFTTHTHHFGKFLDSLRHSAEDRKEVDINA